MDGTSLGVELGLLVGVSVGKGEGIAVGGLVGVAVGFADVVGEPVVADDGLAEGAEVVSVLGALLGAKVTKV